MSLDIARLRSRHGRRWGQVKRGLAEWRHGAYSRGELLNLSNSSLRDMGLWRYSLDFEASKPFWMA